MFMFTNGKIDTQNQTVNSINIRILPQKPKGKTENYSNTCFGDLSKKKSH